MLKKHKKGFTLIELLVVIAIIGILATIVLVSLSTARLKARDARRASDMHQISLAMEMYYDSNGSKYYTGATGPTALGTFMASLPTDPLTTTAYSWGTNSGSDQKYMMCATFENGGYIYASSGGTKSTSAGTCASASLTAQ